MIIDPYKHSGTLLPFTAVSQNGNAFGFTATVANLSDNIRDSSDNGLSTNTQPWIKADLGAVKTVVSVNLTGADLGAGWGEMGTFLVGPTNTGAAIETSTDDVNWTQHYRLDSVTDVTWVAGANKYLGYSRVVGPINARYVRIYHPSGSVNRLPLGWLRVYGY